MGMIGNIREKIGSRVSEIREKRAAEKAEYKEIYDKEYKKAHRAEIEKSARERAKKDAYTKSHPIEHLKEKLGGMGGDVKAPANKSGGRITALGDFGNSIGRKYNNMPTPAWMEHGMPKPASKAKKKDKPLWMP